MENHSPEWVALQLMYEVARAESKNTKETGGNKADRAWILDTYVECLQAVKGERKKSLPKLSPREEELEAQYGQRS